MQGTAAQGEEKSDLDLLCDAWISDMEYAEMDRVLVEGMDEKDWEKYIKGEGRDEMNKMRNDVLKA